MYGGPVEDARDDLVHGGAGYRCGWCLRTRGRVLWQPLNVRTLTSFVPLLRTVTTFILNRPCGRWRTVSLRTRRPRTPATLRPWMYAAALTIRPCRGRRSLKVTPRRARQLPLRGRPALPGPSGRVRGA